MNRFLLEINSYDPLHDRTITNLWTRMRGFHITTNRCYQFHHKALEDTEVSKELALARIKDLIAHHKKIDSSTPGLATLQRHAQVVTDEINEE